MQLLTESVLLAGFGALLGLALATKGFSLLKVVLPADTPRLNDAHMDWPARFSSWPKYIIAPVCCQASRPELNATTGIFAVLAFLTAPASASGFERVMAIPLTLLSIAFWTSVDCFAASGSLE